MSLRTHSARKYEFYPFLFYPFQFLEFLSGYFMLFIQYSVSSFTTYILADSFYGDINIKHGFHIFFHKFSDFLYFLGLTILSIFNQFLTDLGSRSWGWMRSCQVVFWGNIVSKFFTKQNYWDFRGCVVKVAEICNFNCISLSTRRIQLITFRFWMELRIFGIVWHSVLSVS